jgi:PAS domain S-box-containing protein
MKEVAIITPVASMADVARSVVEENGYSNVEIIGGDLNLWKGVEAGRRAIDAGAKVLVSRGGTYDLIKSELDIPVVEIKVTAFDLIESFKIAKEGGATGLVGVIGFKNIISGAEVVAEVMGLRAACFEMTEKSNIAAEVEALIKQGIRVFVGDGNVQDAVARHQCTTILVKSGRQAFQHAIQQAKSILQASRLQKEKAQQFATIIDFVHDGIVAIDRSGRITVFNSASEKITGYNKHKALGKKITEVIPETKLLNILETEQSEIGDIQRLDDHTVIASNRVPVIVDGEVLGAVATYQDITEVQKLEQKIRIRLSEKGFVAQYSFDGIIHESVAISDCIRTAKKFAMYDTSVLICGPSGVGKELFAQGIHNCSPRRNSPFVAINCAALPESLIESELFGYVEGSFTGATKKGKAGLFEMAHGGTILLDEISELPLLLQGRLLRVLQEKQVMRIGDNKLIPVDVRIICATNRDLRSLVSQNLFRVDLYFRIAILGLFIPPLRERVEDIVVLSDYFVKEYSRRYRKYSLVLAADAIEYLRHYHFEGNVRELQGMIERAVVICEGKTIGARDLMVMPVSILDPNAEGYGLAFSEGRTLRSLEDEYIEYVYKRTNGSMKECSAILGIDRTTLWRRIKEKRA